jgi:hypothetical protein
MTTAKDGYRFIVSPTYDVIFFIASSLLVLVILGAYELFQRAGLAADGHAALLTYFLYTSFIDLPHIFQTFSRTHADRTELRRRRRLYTWGLPLIVLSGFLIPVTGAEDAFVAFVTLYGSHHIIRQHVGFVHIYTALNERPSKLDRIIDQVAFQGCLYTCLLNDYALTSAHWWQPVQVYGSMYITLPAIPEGIVDVADVLALGALAVFVLRQLQLVVTGRRLNAPKLLLMAAALGTHYLVFYVADVPYLVAEAIETVYHDVQYHGFVGNFQRRRFPHVRAVALKWLGASLLYGVVAGTLETIGYERPLLYWLFAPFGMLTVFHYWIDGRIWRTRKNPELAAVLGLREPAAGS